MAHFRLVLDETSMGSSLQIFFLLCLLGSLSLCYGYDPLDPNGNVTIKWDIMQSNGDTYDVRVSVFNFQLFRHVEKPGWRLSWDWVNDEVIWNMWGAQATQQGNCSRFKGQRPHSCEKSPVIVDLLPGTPYNTQVANCCKGGVLSSFNQDPSKHGSMFQMNVGGATNSTSFTIAENFTLGLDGYTCGNAQSVPASQFTADGGRRWTQAISTWNVTCIYSQFRASPNPKCCVSLSAFYNNTIVPCPKCSCRCQGLSGAECLRPGEVLQMPHDPTDHPPALVRCTNHMCPIRVHWHVKQSYQAYWRVKITITNFNVIRNYSEWNLVVQHPNLRSLTEVYSFTYQPLYVHGYVNNTGMFWGIKSFNDLLLQSGESGNVQTEMLLRKEPSDFTFREGWAFPRKISFNGDDCVMPQPDDYPRLPNAAMAHDHRILNLPLSIIITLLPLINHFLELFLR
ncbi:COBRA-like protein 6 [Punica granatum]|uniref:COBRA-like protein n=1 Tax=Punica granatum TaxID=22663 RepID=A0A6P8CD71_PUNGR|nr:COBRA-like protein 6 [Punica granatum]